MSDNFDVRGAYEKYLAEHARTEPPFDEVHHYNHTPNQPSEDCQTCIFRGWVDDDGDEVRAAFAYGFLAGGEAMAAAMDRERKSWLRSYPF